MYKNSLVTIDDLSNAQIEDILDLAKEIEADRGAFYGLASQNIMASLFLEPSTRTRGSFEAAMKRLGGDAVTVADPRSSSMEKGESLADNIRIWTGCSDLIVLRHPWEGAARLAADFSEVPVINAGDGSHEHPTQTLLDLYTLRKEFGSLEGLKIVLCGDLKNGRTIHSLVYALLRFSASIIFLPGEGLGLPDHVLHKIETEYHMPVQEIQHPGLEALYGDGAPGAGGLVDAIYMTPSQPHTLTLFDSIKLDLGKGEDLAFYVTRRQTERDVKEGDRPVRRYPRIDAKVMNRPDFSNAVILHPLPRVDELSPEVDHDTRSKYFDQARNGVPVRMALIALMLGLKPWVKGASVGNPTPGASVSPHDIRCANHECVCWNEPQNTAPMFSFFQAPQLRLVCSYCDRETLPSLFAYPRGEVYWPVESFPAKGLDPAKCTFYMDVASAEASKLRPPKEPFNGTLKTKQDEIAVHG